MPFVTEEVWRRFGAGESIVVADWPEPRPEHRGGQPDANGAGFEGFRELVTRIRQFRSDYEVRAGLSVIVPAGPLASLIDAFRDPVTRLAGITSIEMSAGEPPREGTVRLLVGEAELFVRSGEAFDLGAVRRRLETKLATAEAELARAAGKLANPGFMGNAPEDVRRKVEQDHETLRRRVEGLRAQLEELG